MNRNYSLLTLMAAALALALLISCSDDKGNNGDGEELQAQYVQMKVMTDQTIIPLATMLLGQGMSRLDGVSEDDYGLGKAAAPESDSIFVTYHFLSGWWEAFYATSSEAGEDPSSELIIRDSLQFRSVTGANQIEPNDSTDFVHDIPSLMLSWASDSANFAYDFFARNDLVYDDLQSDVATIDGPMSVQMHIEIDTLGKQIAGDVQVTLLTEDLRMPIAVDDDICPLSGVITYTLTENLTSQFVGDETRNTTWSVRITIVDTDTYLIKIWAGNIEFAEYQLAPEDVCSSGFVPFTASKLTLPSRR